MKWTDTQLQTIETRDKNILVSAAAGSGKTTVLIERIKQLVLQEQTDIDRFLITTFTNAAAAEMKEKMERAIHREMDRIARLGQGGSDYQDGIARKRQDGSGQSELAFLQRQLDLLPQASISTFHTFALGIMRDYFYLTDLQPGFVIGDETRLSILRREAVDEVFERRFEDDTRRFKAFLRNYSGDRSDERLKGQLLDIYQQLRSIPRYMDWAGERTHLMQGTHPLQALGIDGFLLEETYAGLTDALHWYEAARQLLDQEETGSLHLLASQDVERLKELRQVAKGVSPDEIAKALELLREGLRGFKANTMRAGAGEKDAYASVQEDVKWLRKKGKTCLDNLKRRYYEQSLKECEDVLRGGAEHTAYFVALIGDLEQIYREKKQARNMVDFDDCMHYCLKILQDEDAAADYRERFRYIFIDEYQDSNLLQEEIVKRIARQDNLFMVGDVKQSIYKFRLAEPEIFRKRYEEYRSGRDTNSVCIDLNCNFRSRRTIRDAVNRIFEPIMDGYDEAAHLKGPDPAEGLTGDPVRLHILDTSEAEESPTEMELIAGIIRDCVGKPLAEGGVDGGETKGEGTGHGADEGAGEGADEGAPQRLITYGDIAVLSRGGAMIPQIERYLNNEGIPAFGETAGGYYETVEIQVFVNLLKVISNPNQDVPLISAMSSVVFDFTARELAQIRIECREGSYHSAVRRYETEGHDPAIREKIRVMMEQICLWKEIGRTVPLDELMRRLLYETGYYDYCSGLPTGEQRVSNLRLLLERAAAYEQTSHLGLFGFLSYVDAMRKTRQKVSEASLMGEGRDVVHVMTVHKSKGLEFPVVILAGAGKEIRASSEGRAPAMHKAFAIGLAEVDRDAHWERKTILQKAIAGKKSREGLEEEIRILYVALTRPMKRLDIVAATKNAQRLQRFSGTGSFLEMVYGTLLQMEEENPDAAQILWYGAHEAGSGPVQQEAADDETIGGDVPALQEAASEGVSGGAEPAHQPISEEAMSEISLNEGTGSDASEPWDPVSQIRRRLAWTYPYETEGRIKTKYTVTELSHRLANPQEEGAQQPQIPELRQPLTEEAPEEDVLTAAQIGTAMHTVMERIDFGAALEEGLPFIQKTADDLHSDGILSDAEYEAIEPENIDAFFRTQIGARAARADVLCREKEFLLRQSIDGVSSIVQGIIDCYFEDENGLALIDYKNSWAKTAADEDVIIQRYQQQIRLYARALQLALGKPVDEAWLYLFRSRKFVKIEIASFETEGKSDEQE